MTQLLRRGNAMRDRGETQVFRLLWVFLSETSVGRTPRFQHLMVSRFFSDAAQESLTYGALVAVVQRGGHPAEVALVGVSRLLPPALFGLYGGAVADATLKRVALGLGYALQALLCFVVPSFFGTGVLDVMFLLFAVHTLGQLSGPAESSIVPFVTTEDQFASATSLLHLVSAVGTSFGTALLAPILVSAFGIEPLMYVAGVMLLLASTRVFRMTTTEKGRAFSPRRRRSVRGAIAWVAGEPAVATMIAVAVVAGTANTVVSMMGPSYVSEVLHQNAANSVYVFAPSAVGLLLAVVLLPAAVKLLGERRGAMIGLSLVAASLIALGRIDNATDLFEPINPVRLFDTFGLAVDDRLGATALVAIVLGFGGALTSGCVQTYINRRVPRSYQSRTFAMQSSLRNGVAIAPLLGMGAAASAFGVERVFVVLPFILVAAAVGLLQVSSRLAGAGAQHGGVVLSSFWDEPPYEGESASGEAGVVTGIILEMPGGTEAEYAAATAALAAKGLWPPPGRLSHLAGPVEGGWRIVETWESEQAFAAQRAAFIEAAKAAGLPLAEPQSWTVFRSET
ncbi:MAG: MFS transporter [Chloroflexi bacterium]|nr:MFS transporter [Chloroflexota bacterium]